MMEGLGKAARMKCHLKMDRVLASREGDGCYWGRQSTMGSEHPWILSPGMPRMQGLSPQPVLSVVFEK